MDSKLNESTASLDVEGQLIPVNYVPPSAPLPGAKKMPSFCVFMFCMIAIIGVVVVAPITLGIFVIGPSIAQHILDTTVISLPNATLNPCDTLRAWGHIHAIFDANTLGLSATLNPYNQSLSTTTCLDESQSPPEMKGGWFCNNATKTLVGTYESPTLELSSGKNYVNLSIAVSLDSANVVTSGLVVPVFLFGKKVRMILEAKDISIRVFGITLSGLTMKKTVTCSQGKVNFGTTPDVPVPNSVCHPEITNASIPPLWDNQGYTLSCVSGDTEPLSPPTTTAAPIEWHY